MKISILIPAYNEETRIKRTIETYHAFFNEKSCSTHLMYELVIVLNGCKDNTLTIVQQLARELDNISIINIVQAGKGLAIKTGFADALKRDNDLIGFVDADMATLPEYFYDLVTHIDHHDGIIASRYMPGAHVFPERPAYKRWGSRLIYEPYVWLLFGISYYDLQCGAKLFKRAVIERITPLLTVTQWAFDVELLYLCKKYGFDIIEIPTTWTDQAESKLTLKAGFKMLSALFKLRIRHWK